MFGGQKHELRSRQSLSGHNFGVAGQGRLDDRLYSPAEAGTP